MPRRFRCLAYLPVIAAFGLVDPAYAQRDPCQPLLGLFTLPADRAACLAQREERFRQMQFYREQQEQAAQAEAQQEAQAEDQRRQRAEAAAALARRQAAYRSQMAAESSPDNRCKDPDVARMIMAEFGRFKGLAEEDVQAVDIEHLTTIDFDAQSSVMSCHGVFVLNDGRKLIGTFTVRRNVAGDLIDVWRADLDQSLFRYDAPSMPVQRPSTSHGSGIASVPVNGSTGPASDGLADRRKWEVWRGGLSGDEAAGATWWSGQRSLAHPGSCASVPDGFGPDWTKGCVEAQQMLAPFDVRRHSEPAYRIGWNSY